MSCVVYPPREDSTSTGSMVIDRQRDGDGGHIHNMRQSARPQVSLALRLAPYVTNYGMSEA